MSPPMLAERLRIAQLAARASRRALAGRVLASPLFRWRLMSPKADDFLLVPPDMRPRDPSFLDELRQGQLGLGRSVLDIGGGSPFAVAPPDRQWARELHGFAWLGHLKATGSAEAVEVARRFVSDWIVRNRGLPGGGGIAGEPDVMARRVTAWITNAGFLLDDAEAAFFRQFTRALGLELRSLDARRHVATPGLPQLECLIALLLASLAITGHDRDRPRLEAAMLAELKRQILADGGHISRNADVLIDLSLDLLPLRECYGARSLPVPPALSEAINRILVFLRRMTLETGRLAQFNGVGLSRADTLATLLALDGGPGLRDPGPGASGYVRLTRGGTTVIIDCAGPPPLAYAGATHAGCLSFEMTHEGAALVVNRGAPRLAHGRSAARATASHSTLVLDEQSSARFVSQARLERLAGGPAARGPNVVTAQTSDADGGAQVDATHDGYLSRYGLIHERRLALSANGLMLQGTDRLRPPAGILRLARNLPFSVHVHLPVDARVEGDAADSVLVRLAGGAAWRLTATACTVSIETATDFAQSLGPSPARQVVLRSVCPGDATIHWQLERLDA